MFAKSLIKVLKEWDESLNDSKLTDIGNLISAGLLQLGSEDFQEDGYHDDPYRYLENRIRQLQKNEGVFEELIVDGLLVSFQRFFTNQINNREEFIYNNEKLLKDARKFIEHGQKISENFIRDTEERILLLNSPEYLPLAKKELETWEEITSRVFSIENRDEMGRKIFTEIHERHKEQMSEEEREKFNDLIKKMK